MDTIQARAVFAGCGRNCASHVGAVLRNIERMSGLFADSAFVFVENDSADSTQQILRDWCADRQQARLIDLGGLAQSHPVWTVRLAAARNAYLTQMAAEFGEYDYLFVLDLDDSNVLPIDLDAVRSAIDFLQGDPSRAGVFANQTGAYYDLWALRQDAWCPGDVWEEVMDDVVGSGTPDEKAFKTVFRRRLRHIAPGDAPIRVASAFGGLGVYKVTSVLANPRRHEGYKIKVLSTPEGVRDVGLQVCEHVSFNAGFSEIGQSLQILPSLINGRNPNAYKLANTWFNPSAFRGFVFDLSLINDGA